MVQRLEFAKNDRVNGQHAGQLLIAPFRVKLWLCPHTMLVMVLWMTTPSVRFWPGRGQDSRSHRHRIRSPTSPQHLSEKAIDDRFRDLVAHVILVIVMRTWLRACRRCH